MAENRRESILAKVQKLLAKAMATPFEAEADSFRAKANEMMDNYRIEQWEIAQLEAGRAKSALKPVRKDVDITWWWNESGAFGSTLWTMSETGLMATDIGNPHQLRLQAWLTFS